jgi:hypothetical protein
MAHGDIAKRYDAIFTADPLLLKRTSQTEYSENLINHLLLKRTLNAFSPMLVNLDDLKERKKFWTRYPWEEPCPPTDVVDRYRASRAAREALAKNDRDALEAVAMVSRGEETEKRKRFLSHDSAIKKLKREKAKSKIANRLRIAAVGYRVQVSRLDGTCLMGEELSVLPIQKKKLVEPSKERAADIELGRTIAGHPEIITEWKAAIKSHVEIALKRKCHFVVVPEFALPPDMSARNTIEKDLHKVSSKRGTADHFVFAGSRHEGGSNKGLVVAKLDQAPCRPWWHHKVASARGLGENIFGPFGTKRPSYAARFHIAKGEKPNFPIDIAICYDAFDPTVFLSLILQSIVITDGEVRPRIMLVPSFNTSKDFVALLRDLSFVSRSTVIYVNGLHGDAKMYVCGFAISDFMDKAKVERMRKQLLSRATRLNARRQKLLTTPNLRPKEAREVNSLNRRARAAELLELQLKALQDAGALDCLITLEDKPKSAAALGRFDPSDLLFYNVDMGLINALVGFRADYFGSDAFLPKPFHYDALRTAAVELRARVAKTRQLEEERWTMRRSKRRRNVPIPARAL